MKIGVISDTHDNLASITRGIDFFRANGVTHVIHCGDMVSPFAAPLFRKAAFDSFTSVFGNNDGEWLYLSRMIEPFGTIAKGPIFPEIAGLRFAIMHEPMPDDILAALPVDIVLYGHTHERVMRAGSPLVINPGEGCGYLTGIASAAIIDTDPLSAAIYDIATGEAL